MDNRPINFSLLFPLRKEFVKQLSCFGFIFIWNIRSCIHEDHSSRFSLKLVKTPVHALTAQLVKRTLFLFTGIKQRLNAKLVPNIVNTLENNQVMN